jgi:hypothetical protein
MKLPLAFVLCSLPCLSSCNLPGRADGIDPNPFPILEQQATAENRDLSRIKVPILRSTVLEKRWGKPRTLSGPKGGYAMRYQDPRNNSRHVTIFGSPDSFPIAGITPPPYTELGRDHKNNTYEPKEVQQLWQLATVNGRLVRYCISEGGDEGHPDQLSTETFRTTAPDGRNASYRIRLATDSSKPENTPKALLESLSF